MERNNFYPRSSTFIKKNYRHFIPVIFSLISIIIIGVLPGFYELSLLFVSIPLLVVPGFLGMHLCVNHIEKEHAAPAFFSFLGFPYYYARGYLGCYRVLIGFLKTLLVSMAALFMVSMVYAPIATAVNEEFANVINDITNLAMQGDSFSLKYLLGLPAIQNYMTTCYLAMSLPALIMMLRHLGVHEMNVSFRICNDEGKTIPTNPLFLHFYASYKTEIRKTIAKPSWIALIFIVLGYLAGLALGYFIFGYNGMMVAMGILLSLAALAFYLPFYDHYMNRVNHYYLFKMQEIAVNEALDRLEAMHQSAAINEQQYQELKAEMDKAKESFESDKANHNPEYPYNE